MSLSSAQAGSKTTKKGIENMKKLVVFGAMAFAFCVAMSVSAAFQGPGSALDAYQKSGDAADLTAAVKYFVENKDASEKEIADRASKMRSNGKAQAADTLEAKLKELKAIPVSDSAKIEAAIKEMSTIIPKSKNKKGKGKKSGGKKAKAAPATP